MVVMTIPMKTDGSGSGLPHGSANGPARRGPGEARQQQDFPGCPSNTGFISRLWEAALEQETGKLSVREKVNKQHSWFGKGTGWGRRQQAGV